MKESVSYSAAEANLFAILKLSARVFRMRHIMFLLLVILVHTVSAQRQKEWPAAIKGSEKVVYKTIGEVKLHLHIFHPAKQKNNAAAIVFFFGGGWKGGTPLQFEQQCRYFASRGMVAITAEYRIRNLHGTLATACVEDGKSAIRWIRSHAGKLGVNPDRIAAGGGSAGGHVAACTGVVKGFEAKVEKTKISSVPNAMILYNPACVLAPIPSHKDYLNEANIAGLRERMGVALERLSPWHNVEKGAPPSLVLHGESDSTVPFWTSKVFVEKMQKMSNQSELAAYPGEGHGFFNFGRKENKMFVATLRRTDEFLAKLGWLKGKPTIDRFIASLPKGR